MRRNGHKQRQLDRAMRESKVCGSRFGGLELGEMGIPCAQTRMRLTEQRAIKSNFKADGIEGFGAMTGIGGRGMCNAGGA